jgi:tetratricopeptide (TPR) repeat protein
MSELTKQNIADYYSLINGLARFLSREDEHGYVFACADYQPLEQEVIAKLEEQLIAKGKHLLALRLQKDPDRSVRAQIEAAIAEVQPDALLVHGLDDILAREVTTGALTAEGARVIDMLNYSREALNELGLPIIFWLSRRNLTLLGNRAADLFAQRRRSVFFFTYQPELETDTLHLQSRFREDFRSSEDYKRLRLQVNLLESQLKEAGQKGYPSNRIAREIALPLATKYSELDLHERAAELLEAYDEAFDPTNPQLLKQLAEIAYKAGKYAEAEQYLKAALGHLHEGESTVRKSELLFDLGKVYSDTGRLNKALSTYQMNQQVLFELTDKGFPTQYDLAMTQLKIGELYEAKGELYEALISISNSRDKLEKLLSLTSSSDSNIVNDLAIVYGKLGDIHQSKGQLDEAIGNYQKYLKLMEQLENAGHLSEQNRNNLAIAYSRLGHAYKAQGQFNKALEYYEKDLDLKKELINLNPQSKRLKNGLAISYERLGEVHESLGHLDEALKMYSKDMELMQELSNSHPPSEDTEIGLAISYEKLGGIYKAKSEYNKAIECFSKFFELMEKLNSSNPLSEQISTGLAISYERLAEIYKYLGEVNVALEYLIKARKLFERRLEINPVSEGLKYGLAITYEKIGMIYQEQGLYNEALNFFEDEVEIFKKLNKVNPSSTNIKNGLAIAFYKLAELYRNKKESQLAAKYYDKVIEISKPLYEQTKWNRVANLLDQSLKRKELLLKK